MNISIMVFSLLHDHEKSAELILEPVLHNKLAIKIATGIIMHDDCNDCWTKNSISFSGNMSLVNVKFNLVIKNNTKVSVSCSGVNKCSVEIVITIVVGCRCLYLETLNFKCHYCLKKSFCNAM